MAEHDEIKAGNLYLYNMNPDIDVNGKYVDMPVIALSKNSNYPTWLCLLPNSTTGGLFPSEMIDITVE